MNTHKLRRNMLETHPFGLRLHKHLSRRRGLSQRALAESIGVDPSVIARMCKGELPSTIELLNERICKIVDFLTNERVIDSQDEIDGFFIDVGLFPPNKKIINDQSADNEKVAIEIMIRGKISSFDDMNKNLTITMIATIFKLRHDQIKVLRVEEGSIKLTIEIPASALERLKNLTDEDEKILNEMNIFQISDQENQYYISSAKNISDTDNNRKLVEINKYTNRMTSREREVCELVVQGLSNRDIAEKLCISMVTLEKHLRNIYVLFNVKTRTGLILVFLQIANGRVINDPQPG